MLHPCGLGPFGNFALVLLSGLKHLELVLGPLLKAKTSGPTGSPGVDQGLAMAFGIGGDGHTHGVVQPSGHLRDVNVHMSTFLHFLQLGDLQSPGHINHRSCGRRQTQLTTIVLPPNPQLDAVLFGQTVGRHQGMLLNGCQRAYTALLPRLVEGLKENGPEHVVLCISAQGAIPAADPQTISGIHNAGVVRRTVYFLHGVGHFHQLRHILIVSLPIAKTAKPASAKGQQPSILGNQGGMLRPAGDTPEHTQLSHIDDHAFGRELFPIRETTAKPQAAARCIPPGEAFASFNEASRMLLTGSNFQHIRGVGDELRGVRRLHGTCAQLTFAAIAPRVHQ
mmetsp:Transcript_20457/g.33598  ORF Transcript_20457/g.33598 Transcript_20457/m.33598 type:complete len:337 (-) Transcript_20457:357-1367(-)